MRLSTLAWIAAIIVMTYHLCNLAEAYYQSVYAWQDGRNHQIAQMLK